MTPIILYKFYCSVYKRSIRYLLNLPQNSTVKFGIFCLQTAKRFTTPTNTMRGASNSASLKDSPASTISARRFTTEDSSDTVNSNIPKQESNTVSSSSLSPIMFPPLHLEKKTSERSTSSLNSLTSPSEINGEFLTMLHNFYKQGQFTDMEIHISGIVIKAHRVVLAAASEYFRAMFSHGTTEKDKGIVQLHDVDAIAVQTLVEFAYTFELNPPLSVENVQPVLYASSILQFNKVLSLCSDFIGSNLDPKHVLSVLSIAQNFALTDLLKIVRNFIARNFHETVARDEVPEENADDNDDYDVENDAMNLSEDDLLSIFADEQLLVRNEMVVLDFLLKWAKCEGPDGNAMDRSHSFRRILSRVVKLASLPATVLYKLIREEPFVSEGKDELLQNTLQDALVCQMDKVGDYRHSSSVLGSIQVTKLNQPRHCSAGALVCVGGRQASQEPFRSAEIYDWNSDNWLRIPDMNNRRRHVGVAVCTHNGRRGLFAVGGHDGMFIFVNNVVPC